MTSPVLPDKPDNLLWIEEVLLNNMQDFESSNNAFHNQSPMKLTIAEIEMRDESFFGDERIPTLSRLIATKIKYVLPSSEPMSSTSDPSNIDEMLQFWLMKLPSISAPERELSRIANVHQREICFYTEILPSLKLWVDSQYIDNFIEFKVPPCFYGKFLRPNDAFPDLEIIDHILRSESLLVLQDLRPNEFGKRHFGEGMTIHEAMEAVVEISKFHAVTYAMQMKSGETLNWKEFLNPIEMVELYQVLFKRGYSTFKTFVKEDKLNRGRLQTAMDKIAPTIRDVLIELLKPETDDKFPSTLIHMDFWSDNILFRAKDDSPEPELECYIIDWQLVSLGSPAHDIALLTLLSMDASTRRPYAQIILQYYYQVFEQILTNFDLPMPFTYSRLVVEYARSCVLAVIMAIASMDVVMLEESTQTRLIDAITDLIEDKLI